MNLPVNRARPLVHTDGSERNIKRPDGTEYDGSIHPKTLRAQIEGAKDGPRKRQTYTSVEKAIADEKAELAANRRAT